MNQIENKMKTPEEEAKYNMAKFLTLSNAAEFIRGHGEEGHSFEDEELDKLYRRGNLKLAKQLDRRALKFLEKYNSSGINIDTEINEDY